MPAPPIRRARAAAPCAALAAALLLSPAGARGGAEAREWRVSPAESHLSFEVTVNGVARTGELPVIEGGGRLDPARPGEARLDLRIRMAALDMGDELSTHLARSVDWFDVEAHPWARFRLDGLSPPQGDGPAMARGRLEIRGVAHDLRAPVSLEVEDGVARAVGEAVVDRRDYGVGRGLSAAMVDAAPEVTVHLEVTARPAEASRPARGEPDPRAAAGDGR